MFHDQTDSEGHLLILVEHVVTICRRTLQIKCYQSLINSANIFSCSLSPGNPHSAKTGAPSEGGGQSGVCRDWPRCSCCQTGTTGESGHMLEEDLLLAINKLLKCNSIVQVLLYLLSTSTGSLGQVKVLREEGLLALVLFFY